MDAEVGIIGGSGFYSLLDDAETVEIETDYGKPSDKVAIGTIGKKKVAFIPRHGSKHTIPPHKVPYRANIEAFNSLGVKRVISTSACGSLRREINLGQIVLFDQLVNMTHGRDETFFDKDEVVHVSTADPYCKGLRAYASIAATDLGFEHRDVGTVVVVNGPRFSTRAESKLFISQGFDLINMTQYPEAALVRERAMCYLGIGIVTDYDAGLVAGGSIEPVGYADVAKVFSQNVEKVKSVLKDLVGDLPKERDCVCGSALDGAMVKV
ncbi:MAG: S-methyl-5'-thioadenosine phosphorylase [Candidatus Micrarchaeota archaeon]|nr:S-methyl-5'-thioadenosine phosphorylase [Candidatus Micrarchaeota archaeon]